MKDQSMLPVAINDLMKSTIRPPEHYILRPTLEQVQAFVATEFAFDIETTGWQTSKQIITMVGLSDKPFHALVVPFRGAYITELKRIFTNAKVLIGQNCVQFDCPILFAALGLEWRSE